MNQPSSQPARQTNGLSYLYMAAAFVVVVAGMRAAESIINPLLLAIFLTIISAPGYFALLSRGISTWLALLIVTGILGAITLGLVFVLTNSIAGFLENQDHYRDRLREERAQLMASVKSWLPEVKDNTEAPATDPPDEPEITGKKTAIEPDLKEAPANLQPSPEAGNAADDDDADSAGPDEKTSPGLKESESTSSEPSAFAFPKSKQPLPDSQGSWEKYMSEQFDPGTVISLAGSVAGSLGQLLSNAILIVLTVIFILLEAGTFSRKIKTAFIRTDEAMDRANEIISSVRNYIVIKTWLSLATGVLVAWWLSLFGVSHAPLWGLLAFLFNYIPNIGSIIAAVPAILVAWLELDMQPAIWSAVGFVLVNVVLGNIVEPRLMGKGLGLSPVVVFASMVFWGWVLGPVGMLLSVPLTMTARIVLEGFDDTKWMATLLGTGE